MSPETVFALLLLATIAWIAIPFIPALSELLRPRDAAPLASVGQDSGLLTYFATSFTERVTNEGLLGTTPPAWLSDGSAVRVHSAQTPIAPERGGTSDVVLVTDETPVPPGVNIAAELFAREVFRGGANGTYRAILGQRDVRLGAGSTVQRWVHANGSLAAATGTRLLGRATSDVSIVLEGGVQFDRLDAPVVRVGDGSAETQILPVSAYSPFLPGNAMVLEIVADQQPHHLRRGHILLRAQVLEGLLLRRVDQNGQSRGLEFGRVLHRQSHDNHMGV